jgi:hypothetical protein
MFEIVIRKGRVRLKCHFLESWLEIDVLRAYFAAAFVTSDFFVSSLNAAPAGCWRCTHAPCLRMLLVPPSSWPLLPSANILPPARIELALPRVKGGSAYCSCANDTRCKLFLLELRQVRCRNSANHCALQMSQRLSKRTNRRRGSLAAVFRAGRFRPPASHRPAYPGLQCAMRTGAVIAPSMLRVTPPSTNSRRRECP